MMRATVTVNATSATINELYLNIPIQSSTASLFHVVTDSLRMHKAERIPTTPLPNTTCIGTPGRCRAARCQGPFVPYVWLGGPERGLAWFAENDKDSIVSGLDPVLEIRRPTGEVNLKVRLVTKPSTFSRAHTITFGLMATPAKPMAKNPSFRQWWGDIPNT